jgi:hypothetical protein
MPFPPEGFVAVAKDLRDGVVPRGEGRYRTVAGRAYYGAYWATCTAICRVHRISPAREIRHELLCNTLAAVADDAEVRSLGNLLNTLRKTRVDADYHLLLPLDEDRSDDAVVDAERVLTLLPSVESRLPRIEPAS